MSGESMSFDELWQQYKRDDTRFNIDVAKSIYEAVAQSRQAEIDELKKRIDELKNWCVSGVECNMLSTEYNQALIDMIKILKGKENEN